MDTNFENSTICLKRECFIRQELEHALLFSIDVNSIASYERIISLEDFAVISLFNGKYTTKSIEYILNSSVFIYNNVDLEYLRRIVQKYLEFVEINSGQTREVVYIESDRDYLISKFNKISKFRHMSPLILTIAITNACNAECIYCYSSGKKLGNVSLPIDVLKKIILESKRMGVALINLTGGDPLKHPEIYELVSFLNEQHMQCFISTKTPILDENFFKLLSNNINMFQFSIDSYRNDVLFKMTNSSSTIEDYLRSFSIAIKNSVKVKVNSVATARNIFDLPKLTEILDENEVLLHQISPFLRSVGRFDPELFPSSSQYDWLAEIYNNYAGDIEIDYPNPNDVDNEFTTHSMQKCSGGRMSLVVKSNGDAVTCERFYSDQIVVGNVYDDSLIDIWNSNSLKQLLLPKRDLFYGHSCFNCDNFEECVYQNGLCYARTFMSNGTIFAVDPYCAKSNRKKIQFY